MTLKIGHKVYKVSTKECITLNGLECRGLCNKDTAEILLMPDMHPEDFKSTLWHEIFHAFEDFMGLSLDESDIDSLAQSLTLFIKENPEFMQKMIRSKPILLDKEE